MPSPRTASARTRTFLSTALLFRQPTPENRRRPVPSAAPGRGMGDAVASVASMQPGRHAAPERATPAAPCPQCGASVNVGAPWCAACGLDIVWG